MQSWKENTTGLEPVEKPPWGSPGKSEGPYWTRVGISISKINLRRGETGMEGTKARKAKITRLYNKTVENMREIGTFKPELRPP